MARMVHKVLYYNRDDLSATEVGKWLLEIAEAHPDAELNSCDPIEVLVGVPEDPDERAARIERERKERIAFEEMRKAILAMRAQEAI